MTPEVVIDLFREALWLTTTLVAILVVPSLIVGLLVSMFQAATQINEQTLALIPKIIAIVAALMIFGGWMLTHLAQYAIDVFQQMGNV